MTVGEFKKLIEKVNDEKELLIGDDWHVFDVNDVIEYGHSVKITSEDLTDYISAYSFE